MLRDLKTLLIPPFSQKDLYSIFIIVFIMVSIPLTVLQVSIGQNSVQTNASTTSSKTNVEIVSPNDKTEVSGSVNVKLTSTSEFQITAVKLSINDRLFTTVNNPLPGNSYTTSIVWDTSQETNGDKKLTVEAVNNLGMISKSLPVVVKVTNVDNLVPSLHFSQPTDGSYVKEANKYRVKLDAADNNGVAHVLVMIDDTLVKNFTSGPYEFYWDTADLKPGTHVLAATAFDLAGNQTTTKIQIYLGVKNLNL